MVWLRALLVWALILVLEIAHGVARTLWLVPQVGDLASRQIGVMTGSALILVVTWFAVRWIAAFTRAQWLAVGVLWLALMTAAEVLLARLLFGLPWSRIAEDFDPSRGGFLAFGMVVLLLAPLATAQVRRLPGAIR
ncbi:MAG TPA: hypothetical protein PLE54_08670 [Burkholderiaceae bacterium]|nr:hypothetical protein [Burkholderiaceae bacterium]HQR70663.1 hypothetical protein [Burkholderiaceae bacterium]